MPQASSPPAPHAPSPTVRVGIVGCGNIFERYVLGMRRFPALSLAGVADIDTDRARTAAGLAGLPAFSVEDLLECADIDVVVNLTPPTAHAELTARVLSADKHVFVEKPMGSTTTEARGGLALASDSGLLYGAAPDTFLASAVQTARDAIDRGLIGEPIAAVAFATHSQAELWHPDPSFLFGAGGGPALDLGVYYLTALVACLGPVEQATGAARIGSRIRTVTAPERRVHQIEATVPTHTSATLTFESGVIATLVMSFDIWSKSHLPHVEIYGTEGALYVSDPCGEPEGPVMARANTHGDWQRLPPVISPLAAPGSAEQLYRGAGVADLAAALAGGPHRATGELAYHVLDVLESVALSAEQRQTVDVASRCRRPEVVRDTYGASPTPLIPIDDENEDESA